MKGDHFRVLGYVGHRTAKASFKTTVDCSIVSVRHVYVAGPISLLPRRLAFYSPLLVRPRPVDEQRDGSSLVPGPAKRPRPSCNSCACCPRPVPTSGKRRRCCLFLLCMHAHVDCGLPRAWNTVYCVAPVTAAESALGTCGFWHQVRLQRCAGSRGPFMRHMFEYHEESDARC